MSKSRLIRNEKVLDSWSVLIEGARGRAGEVYNATQKFIQESNAPEVTMEQMTVRTGRQEKFFALRAHYVERDYLMVTNEGSKDYRMYVGARDYGNDLYVSWYLTCEPGFLKGLVSEVLEKDIRALSLSLDIFQQEDLTAYVTCIHHCLLKAVDGVMQGLGQDPSTIDRKSKGFLGVS